MSIHGVALAVVFLTLACSCQEVVGIDRARRESIESPPSTLRNTLEPLRALLLAAPWLTPSGRSAPGSSGVKKSKTQGSQGSTVKRRKTQADRSFRTVAGRDGGKFIGSYDRVSSMPETALPEVTFMGRSNVGKSSAINHLVGSIDKKAKVSKTPGRTRRIGIFQVGKVCNLADLPGYGFAKVNQDLQETWGRTMTTYLKTRSNLKLAVVLVDVTVDPQPIDAQTLDFLEAQGIPAVVVATKADKLSKKKQEERVDWLRDSLALDEGQPILFSVKESTGAKRLWKAITDACNTLPDAQS